MKIGYPSRRSETSFNEAGAKSAGKLRVQRGERTGDVASMRPAQKAPENGGGANAAADRRRRFNEAGAKSAGKPARARARTMSENAASMRPAQKAPENICFNELAELRNPGFNEAGAKSAGKPGPTCSGSSPIGGLQ